MHAEASGMAEAQLLGDSRPTGKRLVTYVWARCIGPWGCSFGRVVREDGSERGRFPSLIIERIPSVGDWLIVWSASQVGGKNN